MHEAGCSRLVHWDDPEGWDEEGGGRKGQDGERMLNGCVLLLSHSIVSDSLKPHGL